MVVDRYVQVGKCLMVIIDVAVGECTILIIIDLFRTKFDRLVEVSYRPLEVAQHDGYPTASRVGFRAPRVHHDGVFEIDKGLI